MNTSDKAEPAPAPTPNGKKAAANRANAQKSTGPRTAAGKAASRKNALRHGFYSDQAVLPHLEKESEWEAHIAGLMRDLAPVGELESILVEKIASALWRSRRCARYQHHLARAAIERAVEKIQNTILAPEDGKELDTVAVERFSGYPLAPDPASLTASGDQEMSLDKAFYKALHELQRLQQARRGRGKGGKKRGDAPGAHDVY